MVDYIFEDLIRFKLAGVNAYAILGESEVVCIDAGNPGDGKGLAAALERATERPLTHLLLTHSHPDHAGGAAVLHRQLQPQVAAHPGAAALIRTGRAKRPMTAASRLHERLIYNFTIGAAPERIEACPVDWEIRDGESLAIAGGLRAIHIPGHSAGQLAFLWSAHGGVLFAADSAMRVTWLDRFVGNEDHQLAAESRRKLAGFAFEVACFGHGRPLLRGASAAFRRKWG